MATIDEALVAIDELEEAAEFIEMTGEDFETLSIEHWLSKTRAVRIALEQQRVPEGYALVPVNPGPGMVEAFYRAYERPLSPDRWESNFDNAWEALIAAAPQPEKDEEETQEEG